MVANIGNAATNLASTPYTPYPGQTVATPSDATQQAWGMASGNLGAYKPDLSAAESLTQQAGTPITGEDINRYLNPYMGSVIGGLQSAANKNLFDVQLPAIQDRFVSAGQSRSPQEAHLTNEALYNSNQALNQAVAGALGTGYQGALNTAIQQQGAKQTAGAQMGQLGVLNQQLGAGDIGQLAASGQAQDIYHQSDINSKLNEFAAQQQWPYQNLGFASNVVRGLPVNTNQQTVGLGYSPAGYGSSPLSAFVGSYAGSQALGLGRYRRGGPVGALQRFAA